MKVKRLGIPVHVATTIENMNREIEKSAAIIDYLAMMADIDLPIEEEEEDV